MTMAIRVAALLHVALAAGFAVFQLTQLEPLHGYTSGASIALVLATPGVLALLGSLGRWQLLLAAGVTSVVVGLVPFSLHSFALLPLAVVYLAAYGARSHTVSLTPTRTLILVVVIPVLAVAAILLPDLRKTPRCYKQTPDGVRIYEVEEVPSEPRHLPADSDVVATGCASDATLWWEEAAQAALSVLALAIGLVATGRNKTLPGQVLPRGEPGHRR